MSRLRLPQYQGESAPARAFLLPHRKDYPKRTLRDCATCFAVSVACTTVSTAPGCSIAAVHCCSLCRLPSRTPHTCNQARNCSTLRFGHRALTYYTPGSIRRPSHRRLPDFAARERRNRLAAHLPSLSLLSITSPLGRCLCALSSAGISRGSVRAVPAVSGPCPVSNLSSEVPIYMRT